MMLEERTILILEDEPIIAFVLEDKLLDRGARPVLAHCLEDAMAIVGRQSLDLAILDVNIHGQRSYPVAQALREKRTPFFFVTGYGDALHPPDFERTTTLSKPYSVQALDAALLAALASGNAPPEPTAPLK